MCLSMNSAIDTNSTMKHFQLILYLQIELTKCINESRILTPQVGQSSQQLIWKMIVQEI